MADKIRFFADKHFPKAAIKALRQRQIDIINSLEAGFAETAPDPELLKYATAEERIMVTCDTGFTDVHLQPYYETGTPHASILYFRMSTGECMDISLIIEIATLIHGAANPTSEITNVIWRASEFKESRK